MEDTTINNSATTQHEKTLEVAIKRAVKRVPVFPCGLNKEPLTTRGFYDATTDPEVVRVMWENRKNVPCVGVPTGKRSGVIAFDVDTDDEKESGREV